jgi:glycerophosphoryl diester phosphodiesterase
VRPLVIAHRGASGTAPENTLAAFRRAAALGADMIELDVQLSRDRAVIVLHDATLDRTTDGTGPAGARTLAELTALDAGAWFAPAFAGERIPTLAQVLAAVRLPLNVELKAGGGRRLVEETLRVVEAAGACDRVVFSSFDGRLLEWVRTCSAKAECAVLWLHPELDDALRLAERVGARALHLRKDVVSHARVAIARRAGLAVRAWTVNDTAELRLLEDAGVSGIFTDYPERFLQPR